MRNLTKNLTIKTLLLLVNTIEGEIITLIHKENKILIFLSAFEILFSNLRFH